MVTAPTAYLKCYDKIADFPIFLSKSVIFGEYAFLSSGFFYRTKRLFKSNQNFIWSIPCERKE